MVKALGASESEMSLVDNIIGITSPLEAFVALPLLSIVSGHRAKLVQRPNAKLNLEKGVL